MKYNVTLHNQKGYHILTDTLATHFSDRLKLIALFGSRSRGEARSDSDHDIFVVIESLPQDPLARQREVMTPLLPELLRLPERLSVVAKTPQELLGDLTSLVVDVCVDGVALYGQTYFETLRSKILQALHEAGLQRRRVGGTWMWIFPTLPTKEWAVTWEGYHEHG